MNTFQVTSHLLLFAVVVAATGCRAAQEQSPQRTEPGSDRRRPVPQVSEPPPAFPHQATTRNLTALPAGWAQPPSRDRQFRRLAGADRACLVEVLLDDTKHLRVVRDRVPGPAFDDLRPETLAWSPVEVRLAYVGTREGQAFVCNEAGVEFPIPEATDVKLAVADATGLTIAVLNGVRGTKGSQLYVDGKLVHEAKNILPPMLGPSGREWAVSVRDQTDQGDATAYVLTSIGRGPPEMLFAFPLAWSADGRRLAYRTGVASFVVFDGAEIARWNNPEQCPNIVPDSVQFSPDSRDVAWLASSSNDAGGCRVMVNGKAVDVPKDEHVSLVLTGISLSSRLSLDHVDGRRSLQWIGDPHAPLFRTHLPNQKTAVRRGSAVLLEGHDAGQLERAPVTDALHWLTSRREGGKPVWVWNHAGSIGPSLEPMQTMQLHFTRDGSHFAYVARLAGEAKPTLVVDGRPCRGPQALAGPLVFSPDGSRLAYFSEDGVSIAGITDAGSQFVTSYGKRPQGNSVFRGTPPVFTADSKHVAYIAAGYSLCVDGSTLADLGSIPVRPDRNGKHPYDLGPNPLSSIETAPPSSLRVLHIPSRNNAAADIHETTFVLGGSAVRAAPVDAPSASVLQRASALIFQARAPEALELLTSVAEPTAANLLLQAEAYGDTLRPQRERECNERALALAEAHGARREQLIARARLIKTEAELQAVGVDVEEALRAAPDDQDLRFIRMMTEALQGRGDLLVAELRSPSLEPLARIRLASALKQRAEVRHAITLLDGILAAESDQPLALAMMAGCRGDLGETEAQLGLAVRALAVCPDLVLARINEAQALIDSGRSDAALASLQRALEQQPELPKALYLRAVALMHRGQPRPALDAFHGSIRQWPEDPHVYANLAKALAQLERWSEALDACDTALRLDPLLANTHADRAVVLGSLGRPAEAMLAVDAALRIEPDNPHALRMKRILLQHR